MAGFKNSIDRWGNELVSQVATPELIPVLDFRTQAELEAMALATPKPNDGASYIVSSGANKSDIYRWDENALGEGVGGWIIYKPTDLDVTTVTSPSNEVLQGKWRYDATSDTWVQISDFIELPDVIERPVSAENIAFGRVGNILTHGLIVGRMYAYIQNDNVAIWGNMLSFTNGSGNWIGGAAEALFPRYVAWNWYNGLTTYAPIGQYSPKFVDVTHNENIMLAIDHLGKVWGAGRSVQGLGMTTTPLGTAGVPVIPATGLSPISFWQAQTNVFAAKVFVNNAKYDVSANIGGVLTTDGDLYLAGYNVDGQLGQGNLNVTANWVKYPIPNIIDVKMGDFTVFALTADGKLYCTGYYDQASSLIPSPFRQNTPRLMISDVAQFDFAMDAGGNNARSLMVVKTDGTVWGVGANAVGQLGIGNTTAQNAFRQAIGVRNAKSIFLSKFAGNSTTGIIRTDGTVSFCGQNTGGCMGFAVAPALASYSTFVTPAFAAQGTIIEGMLGQTCTLRTASGSIWNAGRSELRGIGHNQNNWVNDNRFQQVPLPEPALAMRGSVANAAGGFNDNVWVLTANHGIICWGGAYPDDTNAQVVQFVYSPRQIPQLRYLNNGIEVTKPLGGKYDAVATITAITAGSASDIYDELSNQFVTISLTTNGTAGKLDTTGATLTGADLSGIALQTSYVYHIGDTGNQIKLVFRLNASDALATGASTTQNYTVTLGGISFNLIGNRIDDVIVKTLSTSRDLYLGSTNLDPVVITEAEYNALAGLSGAVKSANTDSYFTSANSAGAINSTAFLTSVTNVINANAPALITGFPFAFKFKGQGVGDSASFSTTQLAFATTANGVGTALTNNVVLPVGTVMDSANTLYLVIKSANVQTTAGNFARLKYPKGFTTGAAIPSSSFFSQGSGTTSATIATTSVGNNAFGYQVLSLPTKQWL